MIVLDIVSKIKIETLFSGTELQSHFLAQTQRLTKRCNSRNTGDAGVLSEM
jgi:hypothetical protein